MHTAHPNLDVAPPTLPAPSESNNPPGSTTDDPQPEPDSNAPWEDEQFNDPEDPPLPVDPQFWGRGDKFYRNYHTKLNGMQCLILRKYELMNSRFQSAARPCDEQGAFLGPGIPAPSLADQTDSDDWAPYDDRVAFEMAEFLFTRNQMSAPQIDVLLDLWAASLLKHGDRPAFANHRHLYNTIDSTTVGDIKWDSLSIRYTGVAPLTNPPPWMQEQYKVWFRNPRHVVHRILGNPSIADDLDLRPFREYQTENDTRQYQDFMSGDWAWEQAVRLQSSICLSIH